MGWAPNHKCVNGQYQSKKLPGTREPQCNRCATLGTSVVTCLLWQSLWGALDFSVKLERNANSNKKKKLQRYGLFFLDKLGWVEILFRMVVPFIRRFLNRVCRWRNWGKDNSKDKFNNLPGVTLWHSVNGTEVLLLPASFWWSQRYHTL